MHISTKKSPRKKIIISGVSLLLLPRDGSEKQPPEKAKRKCASFESILST
jgi:hypothetical protein